MRKGIAMGCVSLGMVACAAAVVWAELKVKGDKENVVASRLVGKWVLHAGLTERLTGKKAPKGKWGYEFSPEPAVAGTIPETYAKLLKDKPIYLAGKMKRVGAGQVKEHPFLLTTHRGNPRVFYFVPTREEPAGHAESLNVMLAVAEDKAKDLLFVGGDFNNQPFFAFERASE